MNEFLEKIEALANELDRLDSLEATAGKWDVSVETLSYRTPNMRVIRIERVVNEEAEDDIPWTGPAE